jgi:hypothetical protein
MKALILALLLGTAPGLDPGTSLAGDLKPLFVTEFRAQLITQDGRGEADVTLKPDSVTPLPMAPEVIKLGWTCMIGKRARATDKLLQPIVCSYDGKVMMSATAVCMTSNEDVDIQRVMVGDLNNSMGIVLGCHTARAVGAEL